MIVVCRISTVSSAGCGGQCCRLKELNSCFTVWVSSELSGAAALWPSRHICVVVEHTAPSGTRLRFAVVCGSCGELVPAYVPQ